MKPSMPLCCKQDAWELLLREVPTVETPESLVRLAVALALPHCPGAQVEAILEALRTMAQEVRSRVHGDQPQALLAHLHEFLFEELGFRGEAAGQAFSAADGYLPRVLKRRRGSPILLSLVYVTVARWAGLDAWGVGTPGHFLSAVECDGRRIIVDPFDGGRMLSEDDVRRRLESMFGPDVEFTSDMLEPVSHRLWLTRMMQNLLRAFGAAEQYADVGAMLEMEMVLWPGQEQLQRDLALVLARMGMAQSAVLWLDRYLSRNPNDPQKDDLEQLRAALNV